MLRFGRRVQQIGSSFLVSLPSGWVKKNNLKKGNMVGYNIIRIKGTEEIAFDHRDRIKHTMRTLAGLEIIEEDSTNIICQFLLDAGTLDIEKILRRMNTIIAGMYKDTIDLLGRSSENNIRIRSSPPNSILVI